MIRKCATSSLYNQTLLTVGSKSKCFQRNEIWQMGVFQFSEFGKLKYMHHTMNIYSEF